jgi:ribosomal protein S18 acetylase RimI-like enzyme
MAKTDEPKLPDIEFHNNHSRVDWQELEGLFTLTKLGGRKGDKLRRAFLNSQVVCYAYDGDRLVGVGRAITDGEYHAFVYDVAIHPRYQGRGLGTKVVRTLLNRLPVWRTMLVASADVQPFYALVGFAPYPDVMARLNPDKLYDAPALA